jgi:hypothetical protein
MIPEVFGKPVKFHWETFRHYDLVGTDQGDSERDFEFVLKIETHHSLGLKETIDLLEVFEKKWWLNLDPDTRSVVHIDFDFGTVARPG